MLVLACLWGIRAESAKKNSQRCCLGERLIDGLADQFTPLPSRRALSRSITSSVLRRVASRLSWAWIAFSRRLPRGASPPALGGRRRGGNPTAIRLPYNESQSIPPTQQCSGLALISPPTDQTRSETNTGKQTERNA